MISSFLARRRSSLRLRASLVFERRASAWSLCFRAFGEREREGKNVSFGNDAAELKPGRRRENLRQELLASLVCLQFVDVLHQDALVFEDVALGLQI